MDILKS